MAQDYLAAVKSGDRLKMLEFCTANEGTDIRTATEFVEAARSILICELAATADESEKKRIMEKIEVLGRCTYYLRVNTGIRHVFGLLSVT